VTFLIIAPPYKYSNLLTDQVLVGYYLWHFYGLTFTNHVVGEFLLDDL